MKTKRAYRPAAEVRPPLDRRTRALAFVGTLLALSASVGAAIFVGCSSSSAEDAADAGTTGNFTTGSVNAAACDGAFPNGECRVAGQAPETCDCEDCKATAMCNGRCEGAQCNYAPGTAMDCTCEACFTNGNCLGGGFNPDDDCSSSDPENEGYNPECSAFEVCPCPDCSDEDFCSSCDNNGACDLSTEGCGCGDCAEQCGSGPSSSSSSGAGGAGGAGGGAASSSSSAAAGGAAGAGGA